MTLQNAREMIMGQKDVRRENSETARASCHVKKLGSEGSGSRESQGCQKLLTSLSGEMSKAGNGHGERELRVWRSRWTSRWTSRAKRGRAGEVAKVFRMCDRPPQQDKIIIPISPNTLLVLVENIIGKLSPQNKSPPTQQKQNNKITSHSVLEVEPQ